jgi:hypothetical protein
MFTRTFYVCAALLVATPASAGAEVPAQYRGLWCAGSNGTRYYRCQEATGEGSPQILRKRLYLTEEGSCHIVAVTPTAKDHRLRLRCDPSARLYGQSEVVNLRLDARDRLHFD